MGLLCSRIGCSSKAASSLQFNAAQSTAILVDLTSSFGGMPLCEVHANSRTAPVGWSIVDQRTGAGNLAVWSNDEEVSTAPPAARPPSRRPSSEKAKTAAPAKSAAAASAPAKAPRNRAERRAQQQQAAARSAVESAATPVEAEAEPVAEPEKPQADFPWHKNYSDEDDDEDLIVDSPLLSRAFRAGRQ